MAKTQKNLFTHHSRRQEIAQLNGVAKCANVIDGGHRVGHVLENFAQLIHTIAQLLLVGHLDGKNL